MKRSVVIIEDNLPLAEGFAEAIQKTENFTVKAIYTNCEDALKNIFSDNTDIYLLDVDLPGMNGVLGAKKIKDAKPTTNIIMVTVHENSTTVFNALCAGATGYLTKNITPEQLVNALNEALNGGAPMSIKIAKMVVDSFRKKTTKSVLSKRERDVLILLSEGNSYSIIAEKLFISKNTIKFHLKNIYLKLQVNSSINAINKATKQNLI